MLKENVLEISSDNDDFHHDLMNPKEPVRYFTWPK